MRKFVFAAVAACAFAPQLANASGYGLREHSADAMGSAYAGSAATYSDASYLAYNPAALGFVESGDFAVSVAGIFPDVSSHYSGTTSALTPTGGPSSPSGFVSDAAIPAITARWRVADRWALGIAVTAPWGLMTTYPHDWTGRYYGVDTKLTTVNIAPLISYEISPHVVIAAGPQAQYASGTFTEMVDVGTLGALNHIPGSIPGAQDISAKFKANDWSWGWTVGVMAQVNEALSLGASYRSSIDMNARGRETFKLDNNATALTIRALTGLFENTNASTLLTTPAQLNAGARLRLSDQWSILGQVDWTQWSSFDNLRIRAKNPFQPDDFTRAGWKDTWFFAFGAEFKPNDRWTFKAGTAFDESPIPDDTRGPRIPDSDRTWLSIGLGFQASDNVKISLSAAHLFFSSSSVHLSQLQEGNALRGNLNGSIDASVNVVAAQLSWRCP